MSPPGRTVPRDRQLNLSLTADELEAIRRRAEGVGLRPAHFGRLVLLETGKQQVVRPTSEESPLTRLIHNHLVRIGNNLNQLMRHCHRTGSPPPPDLAPLLKDIREIIARTASDQVWP